MNRLKLFFLLGSALLLTACQTDPYAYRQACLTRVIAQCKQQGWHYSQTNPDCQRAAVEGIYGLSATQFMACRAADQHRRSHTKTVDNFVVN